MRGQQKSVATEIDIEAVGFGGRVFWWIAYSVSVLILGLLLLLFAPQLFPRVRDAVRDRMGSSIGWGVGLFFLLPIGSVLLLITVVGFPLGIFTLARARLDLHPRVRRGDARGRELVLRTSTNRFVVFLVGWVILRLLALIPVVGGLVWFLASVWGSACSPSRSGTARSRPSHPPAPCPRCLRHRSAWPRLARIDDSFSRSAIEV